MDAKHLLIFVGLLAMLAAAIGPGCKPASPDASAGPNGPVRPADPNLSRLLLERPESPVVEATDATPSRLPAPDLPKEGETLVDRAAKMSVDANGWPVLGFLDEQVARGASLRVLPCVLREKMELLAEREPNATFHMSGEITRTGDRAYLLPMRASVYRSRKDDSQQPDPNNTAEAVDANGPSTPEDIMDELLKDAPDKPVRLPDANTPADPNDSRDEGTLGTVRQRPPKSFVADRLVYISPEADDDFWWLARFVGDNTLNEEPLRLLPNRKLMRARAIVSERKPLGVRFTVSGVVTRYRGRRYLLIRKVLVHRDMGQL